MLAIMMEVIGFYLAQTQSLIVRQTMPQYMHSALLIIRNMGVDAFNYRGKSVV